MVNIGQNIKTIEYRKSPLGLIQISNDPTATRVFATCNLKTYVISCAIWYRLYNFKKREKHPWRSVTFSNVAGVKLTFLHQCFSRFLNCTNGTKQRNASHINIWKNINPQIYRKNENNHTYLTSKEIKTCLFSLFFRRRLLMKKYKKTKKLTTRSFTLACCKISSNISNFLNFGFNANINGDSF